jgi:hypothetical protein
MTPFGHLSVLISMIIGLGLTHLLAGIHQLVLARKRVRLHWLPLTWMALMFLGQVEWWWASFGWRQQVEWNFFYFLFVLLSPITMYIAVTFVLPDLRAGTFCDLRQHYFESRGWFFGFAAVGPLVDAIRRGLDSGSFGNVGTWTNALATALVASLAVTDKFWYHVTITLAVSALFLVFLVSAAMKLG